MDRNPAAEALYQKAKAELRARFDDLESRLGIADALDICADELDNFVLDWVQREWYLFSTQDSSVTPYPQRQVWRNLKSALVDDLDEWTW